MPAKTRSMTRKTVTTTTSKGPMPAPSKGGKKKPSMVPMAILAFLVLAGIGVAIYFFTRKDKKEDGTKAPSAGTIVQSDAYCAVDTTCLDFNSSPSGTGAPSGTPAPVSQATVDRILAGLVGSEGVSAVSTANQAIVDTFKQTSGLVGEVIAVELDAGLLDADLAKVLVDLDLSDPSGEKLGLYLLSFPLAQIGGTGDKSVSFISVVPGQFPVSTFPEGQVPALEPDQSQVILVTEKSLFGGTCPPLSCR